MIKIMVSVCLALITFGHAKANEGNFPPVAVLTEDPDRTWFYNGEQVVFSSTSSSDPDGYVNYSKFYVNGVLKKSSSYTTSYATCFVLYGSGITGCQELSNGATTVQVKLEVRDNAGEWSSETITYTIQERKGRRYFIADHLGSVRATVDDKGEVVGYDDFYPFGKVMPGRSSNSSNPNDLYKFTGHERDEEAGLELDYMNARNYDPIIGRFLQIDPLSDQFPAWNPYHYVYNNPLGFTDPTGMAPYNSREDIDYSAKNDMAGGDDCPNRAACRETKAAQAGSSHMAQAVQDFKDAFSVSAGYSKSLIGFNTSIGKFELGGELSIFSGDITPGTESVELKGEILTTAGNIEIFGLDESGSVNLFEGSVEVQYADGSTEVDGSFINAKNGGFSLNHDNASVSDDYNFGITGSYKQVKGGFNINGSKLASAAKNLTLGIMAAINEYVDVQID